MLELDSFHIKALYRRAQCYLSSGDFLEAEQDIKAGLLVEEKNLDLQVRAWGSGSGDGWGLGGGAIC